MMRWHNVRLAAFGYRLPETIVTSAELEERLVGITNRLGWNPGYLTKMTGIEARRWWQPGYDWVQAGGEAAGEALERSGVAAEDIGAVVYGGVCRPYREPATACAIADQVGVQGNALVHDVGNACLGCMDAMISIANRIELGQIKAGIAVSCESAREINETVLRQLHENPNDLGRFLRSLATFTGGSAAVAVVLTHESLAPESGHRLHGGVSCSDPRFHHLCRWGYRPTDEIGFYEAYMDTDASAVLNHGVALGVRTWDAFLAHTGWQPRDVDRTICHQVGEAHRDAVLDKLGTDPQRDFITYPHLGNTGSCALPLTMAKAAEAQALQSDEHVALLGIGSGLNCTMLALDW